MSNPDQTPPRRGRAPIRRNVGQGSSGERGGAPVPGQEPQPPAPHPAGRGITSESPHDVQFVVGDGGSGTVDPSVGGGSGGGSTAVLQIGGVYGSGSGGVVQRKRTREGDDGAGPSRPVRDAPPPPSPPPPPPPPPAGAVVEGQGMFYCSICDRYFDSDRGLCGHLRTHADRGYRGAFPPPTFTRQEFVDEGVEHLLNPLDGGDMAGQGGVVVEPPAAAGGGVGAPAGPNVEERAEGAAEASGEAERRRNLDLNAPPPRDERGDFI
ncbi:hypothetical protein RHMOL_Rhmol08G0033600 [Rhododendron molle]|uniref:Uncharacterized protein n=1 Tax=Rhododendron molle TaxID=49168 RepID=A0ACC0MJA6_RHOML|nr:hypothetical protein RHMOL_Rhmol08G0033600 [Rhododendron molle]